MKKRFLLSFGKLSRKSPTKVPLSIFQQTAQDSREVSIYCQYDLNIPEHCTTSSVSSVVPVRSDVKSCYSVSIGS